MTKAVLIGEQHGPTAAVLERSSVKCRWTGGLGLLRVLIGGGRR